MCSILELSQVTQVPTSTSIFYCYNCDMNEKTVFEKIAQKEIPASVIYEDDQVMAILDIDPFEKGHTVVIPKTCYETVWDMPTDLYMHLQSVVQKIAGHMHEQLGTPVAIFQRNLPGAGQVIPHVHVLVLPRHTHEDDRPVFNDTMENRIAYDSEEEKQSFVDRLSLM